MTLKECHHCPILEQTGDGTTCGRCWFFLEDGKTCPRHGDVEREVIRYRLGHGLTIENKYRQRRGLIILGKRKEQT